MSSKYKAERIKFSKLAPRPEKTARPVATSNQENSTIHDLLKNIAPRNIPKSIKERFKTLSQRSIVKMIREVSESVKSANGSDKRILEVTSRALQELLKEKTQGNNL